MRVEPSTELMYLKGVGPHRAELLARRGLRTFEDLLGYLPFRYEDRIHFAKIREIVPGQTYTIQAEVSGGSLVGYSRARGGVYHLVVRDGTGSLACKFFHGNYLEAKAQARAKDCPARNGRSGPGAPRPDRDDQPGI